MAELTYKVPHVHRSQPALDVGIERFLVNRFSEYIFGLTKELDSDMSIVTAGTECPPDANRFPRG